MTSHNKDKQHAYEKKIQCLCQQVHECHKHIELIQEELESTRGRLSAACRDQDDLRRTVNQRDETIICLEAKLDNIRFDLKEKETNFQRQNDGLQEKVCLYSEQLQQKESALIVYQSEVKNHLNNMEELKESFCCDIQQKDSLLFQMRETIQNVYQDLKCKSDENAKLTRDIIDLKTRLAQSNSAYDEAESNVACLQEKIPLIESQFSKEKQQAVTEMEELEKKLCQALSDLNSANGEVRKMKRSLQEREEELELVSSEKDNLCRELHREKEEGSVLCDRLESVECDNKEICRLLQIKIKNMKEMEQTLCMREQELGECRCCVDELNSKIRELNVKVAPGEGNIDDIDACQRALRKSEEDRKELEKKLQYAVSEMENLVKEVKRLKCELEEARNEVCDKDMLIEDLEQTLEHAKNDMETRMCRVDQQLEKYEKEIKDKTHMLAEAEDKCCRYQGAVCSKNQEIEDLDQKLSRSHCEIEGLRCQAQELQDSKQCIQSSYNEERARKAELCQENKLNRDQLQMSCNEISHLKRELSVFQRDLECHMKENNDLRCLTKDHECRIQRLTEEKGQLSNKLTSAQCRLEEETNHMVHKLSETKNRLDCEVDKLRKRVCEMEESNSCLNQKVSSKERQIIQMEKGCYQKVDALSREISLLQSKLEDKEYQLQATKDGMTVKDSEIMRLRLRLCSLNRSNSTEGGDTQCQQLHGSNAFACLDYRNSGTRRRTKSCDGRQSCCS